MYDRPVPHRVAGIVEIVLALQRLYVYFVGHAYFSGGLTVEFDLRRS